MFAEVIGMGVKYLLFPGCQEQPQLSVDPNVLKAINKAAHLWGEGHPDVIAARQAYNQRTPGASNGYESYVHRIEQTHNCCNKCDYYASKAQEKLDEIESLITPLLDSPQAGILGVKAGVKDVFTKPLYLIPICVLLVIILIFVFRR